MDQVAERLLFMAVGAASAIAKFFCTELACALPCSMSSRTQSRVDAKQLDRHVVLLSQTTYRHSSLNDEM